MKIASSELAFQADHSLVEREERHETLLTWRGEPPTANAAAAESTLARISDAARQAFSADSTPATTQAAAIEDSQSAVENDPFLAMIRQMIEFLTGETVRVFDMNEFSARLGHVERASNASGQALQARRNGGMAYDLHTVREEFEQTRFSASGTVRTADGQEVSFSIDLEMTRLYREETHVSLRTGNAVRKDPLVVNFGGSAAQLTADAHRRFLFDLDGDGRTERLPGFAQGSGSGYLAIDLNGNGRIDDGRELFGPHSGNGFAELALLDEDGNGWIDAGDSAFDRLSVWTPAADGAGELRSLADLGIGALALAHAVTPFALRGQGNEDLGLVKSTGLYLGEDGRPGILQEIDLTV